MKKIMGIMAAALMLAGSLCADEARIQNVLAKIRRGEKVTVAVLGGSITTGYSSNPISSNSWAAKTEEWFKSVCEKSGSSLTFLNEGVS